MDEIPKIPDEMNSQFNSALKRAREVKIEEIK